MPAHAEATCPTPRRYAGHAILYLAAAIILASVASAAGGVEALNALAAVACLVGGIYAVAAVATWAVGAARG